MRRARKYTKQIELWQTAPTGQVTYGSRPVSDTLITRTWCRLVTMNKISRSTDVGITQTFDTIKIELRKRNDLTYNSKNQYFKYKGIKYFFQSEPIDVGFENREIQIILKKQSIKEVESIEPIQGNQNQNQNQNQNGQGG